MPERPAEEPYQPLPVRRTEPRPLYQRIKEHLAAEIANGRLRKGDRLLPEEELCRQYGVSSITMRRALLELAREGLIRRQAGVGTVVVSETRRFSLVLLFIGFREEDWRRLSGIFGSLLGGIGEAVWAASADLMTLRLPTDADPTAALDLLLRDRSFDGLLIRSAGDVVEEQILLLEGRQVPYVVIKRHIEGRSMNFVTLDDRAGARTATEHLLRLGYSEVGLIMGPTDISPRREQLEGYREALLKHGLAVDEALILQAGSGPMTEDDGYRLMTHLLRRGKPPRAVFVAGDSLAVGAYAAVHDAGLRIPEDIAMVGYGDLDVARALRPGLTTVATSYYDIGRAAAQHLLEQLAHPHLPARGIFLPPSLVVRESCGSQLRR
jgi:DNA-binding LacI/PurR family transcriptional regulator